MDQDALQWKRFGALLRKLRLKSGFGLREFAQEVDLSPTYISRVETGKIPPPTERRLKIMARLLGASPDLLYATAGKVDPDVEQYVRRVRSIPAFLRAARKAGLGEADFERMEKRLKRGR